jgi:hypothetical protein
MRKPNASLLARVLKPTAIVTSLVLAMPGCYRGGGRLFALMAGTAILTAAIVSSRPPPPPRVVYVPAPRPGYFWQPGYWTIEGGEWVWVEGQWITAYPGYRWEPTAWVEDGDGHWRLVPGRWVRTRVPPPPPPPPPPEEYDEPPPPPQ